VFLVLGVELLGVRSLAFAVGSYLSIGTTMAIFAGGAVRWLAERGRAKGPHSESEVSPGSLYASGLIAAGGVFGLLSIVISLLEDPEVKFHFLPPGFFNIGPRMLGGLSESHMLGVIMFALLAGSLFFFARKKLD
jgi:hypothetical protein